MSYTPTTWAAGDTVTAAKLNKLEQGVASGGGVLVVNVTVGPENESRVCDKTAGEIWAVANAGGAVAFKEAAGNGSVIDYMITALHIDSYEFSTGQGNVYAAESASDYPTGSGE